MWKNDKMREKRFHGEARLQGLRIELRKKYDEVIRIGSHGQIE